MTSSRPHRSRLSFGTPGLSGTPSWRVSSCASWPAESRHSFGPACSACTFKRSMSSLAAAAGSTAERRSRSSRPPRETNSRIASSESTGVSCQPSPRTAGITNSATGRSTRSTASSCSPATASQVGEAIRHVRSCAASNWSGCASTHRERSSACPAGRPRRVASARRCAPTSRNTVGCDRSIGRLACARRRGSSRRLADAVICVQSRPASASARAWLSVSAWIATSVRCLGFSVIPWRRSTACACSSVVRHASGSLGSTGSLLASRASARQLRCSNARLQRGKQRCS